MLIISLFMMCTLHLPLLEREIAAPIGLCIECRAAHLHRVGLVHVWLPDEIYGIILQSHYVKHCVKILSWEFSYNYVMSKIMS